MLVGLINFFKKKIFPPHEHKGLLGYLAWKQLQKRRKQEPRSASVKLSTIHMRERHGQVRVMEMRSAIVKLTRTWSVMTAIAPRASAGSSVKLKREILTCASGRVGAGCGVTVVGEKLVLAGYPVRVKEEPSEIFELMLMALEI